MKTVVFGGSGFVGSHVADALSDAGHEVTVFDRRASPYLRNDQKFVRGDIRDTRDLEACVEGAQNVYNFAGLANIDESRTRPIESIELNILGNARILEACRKAQVERFVFASSIYVYSESGSFYRASKQACEAYIEEYAREFGLGYSILRFGTLYGPRADDNNSVHRYLRQAIVDRKIVAHGTGNEIREYIHVKDAARLAVEILAEEYRDQPIILTGHHPMRFHDLLDMVRDMLGRDVTIELHPPRTPSIDGGSATHYATTPYTFRPKIGRKLVARSYLDMGQGLLECMDEVYRQQKVTEPDAKPSADAPVGS